MYKRCKVCGRKFRPYSQVIKQSYCSKPRCQGERKRLWQKEKRKNDSDYKDNQLRAQRDWLKRNPNYWRDYRYRKSLELKNKRTVELNLMAGYAPIPNGFYRLIPLSTDGVAKMDEWTVEIKLISNTYDQEQGRKERT